MTTLIGMFDSPYVRRVAVTLCLLEIPFKHRNWSVFSNADSVREYSPLGRVPVLVTEELGSLVDSTAILDYLDQRAGPERALIPAAGTQRQIELQRVAVALGGCDIAVSQVYEVHKRPLQQRSQDWLERRSEQLRRCAAWLDDQLPALDTRPSQSQITATAMIGFMRCYLGDEVSRLEAPRLLDLASACERLPAFRSCPLPEPS